MLYSAHTINETMRVNTFVVLKLEVSKSRKQNKDAF